MRWVALKYVVSLFLVLGSGYALMYTSYRVQALERELSKYDRDITREQEAIRVLNAEWAYLNNPLRLEELAQGYMSLVSPQGSHLLSNTDSIAPQLSVSPPENVPIPVRSPLYVDISTLSSFSVKKHGGGR